MTSKFVYAGFWLRFVAVIIDNIIIFITSSIISSILGIPGGIYYLILIGYYVYLESSEYQGTVGKILLGLKVTDLKGHRITPTAAFIRVISRFLSTLILGIGYLMAAFTEKKQALHDLIANTLVIQKTATETVKNEKENSRQNDEAIEVTPKEKVVTAE